MPPIRSSFARSPRSFSLPLLALVLPLLAGCGGAAPPPDLGEPGGGRGASGGKGGSGELHPDPQQPGFMRVGEVISVPLMTAEAPAEPPPPPASAAASAAPDAKQSLPRKTEASRNERAAESKGSDKDPQFSDDVLPGGTGGKHSGAVQGAVVDSQGGLSEAEVRATIVQKQASFRECYDLGNSASSGFSGTVTLRAAIGPTGTVASVDIVNSTTRNLKVDSCVQDAVRRIQFPAKGGGAVIAFPIEFGK